MKEWLADINNNPWCILFGLIGKLYVYGFFFVHQWRRFQEWRERG